MHKYLGTFFTLLLSLPLGSSCGCAQQNSSPTPSPRSTAPITAPERSIPNEDWSSISLAGSRLKAKEPLLGEKDEYPGFTRELVQVEWRSGDPIYLYVILPKGVPKAPVVLYLYGFPLDADRFLNDEFCKLLTKNGFAAVGFVSALTGQRYHDRPMKEWFVSQLQESLGSSAHDVRMILDYLSTRPDIDINRVGMFGEGSGGAIAVLAAAADPRIRAIDLLNPWGDWPDWLANSSIVPQDERADYVKPDFLNKVAPLDPIQWLPRLKIPIRLQYLDESSSTPKIARERLEAAVPSQAQVIPSDKALAEYRASSGTKFLDWIKDEVRTASSQSSTAYLH